MHFHHRLLNYGMNHAETVSAIYFISAVLSLCTVALANSSRLKFFLVPILILTIVLMLSQITGLIDLSKWTRKLSDVMDHLFPFKFQNFLANVALRLIQLGALIYVLAFSLGLPWVPANLLLISSFTILLVLYLLITRGQNGESFLIFTLFFLATMVVVVTEHLLRNQHVFFGLPFQQIETLVFWTLVLGVFGKVIFRKSKELVLDDPIRILHFFNVGFYGICSQRDPG